MKLLKTLACLSAGALAAIAAVAGTPSNDTGKTCAEKSCASCACAAKPADAKAAEGCASGVCSAKQASSKEGFALLTSGEMKKLVEAKEALVIDARTGKFDDGQRIPGAKALSPKASKEEVEMAIPNKGAAIVTYCSNLKCPASEMLAKHLKSLGYTNIREYPEGIQGWIAAGNPVEKAAK